LDQFFNLFKRGGQIKKNWRCYDVLFWTIHVSLKFYAFIKKKVKINKYIYIYFEAML